MRKINTLDFSIAKRTTARDINRRIALNLIRAHEPISRADLARKMNTGRGVITVLINELIGENLIFEGAKGKSLRGRKPKHLYVKTDNRLIVAVDIRYSRTFLMLTNFAGKQIALETFETNLDPKRLVKNLAQRILRLLDENGDFAGCEGIGVVVPGNVEHRSGRILRAPTLGWENVEIRERLAAATNLPVKIENAPKACALAQIWLSRHQAANVENFVYVSVSDGVGVGIVIGGEIVRGRNDIAGEFGHLALDENGARCACGKRGCWETYISNLATVARYFGEDTAEIRNSNARQTDFQTLQMSITDLIARARGEDAKALDAVLETGRFLGRGLATIINALNPERIYIGGEITSAWDLIAGAVRGAIRERVLVAAAADTPLQIAPTVEYPRLRGAASLIVAPTFAALKVA
jgi:N-acetylglucosamine repressor